MESSSEAMIAAATTGEENLVVVDSDSNQRPAASPLRKAVSPMAAACVALALLLLAVGCSADGVRTGSDTSGKDRRVVSMMFTSVVEGVADAIENDLREALIGFADEGDFDKAMAVAGVLEGPDAVACVAYVKGCQLAAGGDFPLAVETLADATDLEPGRLRFIDASLKAAMTLIPEGQFDKAREYLLVAANASKDKSETTNACSLLVAETYYMQGEYEKSQELYAMLPRSYSFAEISVQQRLGAMQLIGSWEFVKGYEEGVGEFDTGDLREDIDTVVKLTSDGRWYGEIGGVGAYGAGAGTWEIDTGYDGPDDFGIVFDKGTNMQSACSVVSDILTIRFADSSSVLTFQKI